MKKSGKIVFLCVAALAFTHVYAGSEQAPSSKRDSTLKTSSRDGTAKTTKRDVASININLATASELAQFLKVNKSVANEIIKYRSENGRFSSKEQLKNVKGITNATFTAHQKYISL